MEKRRLYMDYSATTPVKKEVLDEMMPYFNLYLYLMYILAKTIYAVNIIIINALIHLKPN